MTDKQAYEMLADILHTISKDDYPEIHSSVFAHIDEDAEGIYSDPFFIAAELHEADATKQLPECVVNFLLKVYEEEIAEGNANAACNIGSLYYTGRAGEQNYAKALKYYTIAADGGCRQAQENLGYCYYYGRATEVDYEKAFYYFALGAFDGHICSLYKIGDMYRNGYYVKKNEIEAYSIYKRCLETMTAEAMPLVGADVMMRIADCYFEGIGTEVEYEYALEYYQKAEQLFYKRLQKGDFLIKGNYQKVIERQEKARQKMKEKLPSYEWTDAQRSMSAKRP